MKVLIGGVIISKKSFYREILDWIFHILIAVIIGYLIVTFVAQRTIVFNYSMEDTLHEGDNLLVEKITPRFGKLKRGDIVTIKNASKSLTEQNKTIIKRIIALEGETVDIKNGYVYINGERLDEDYIKGNSTMVKNPEYCTNYVVEEGYVYVLGDNRKAQITDSREIGPISVDKIKSRAIFRFYPFNEIGTLY